MMDAVHAEGKECGAIQHLDGVALIHAEVPIKELLMMIMMRQAMALMMMTGAYYSGQVD